MATKLTKIKIGQKVTYAGRVNAGTGKVIAVRDTLRGPFVDVWCDRRGKTVSLRMSQVALA